MSALNILVLVKYVPDAQLHRSFGDDLRLNRAESILSELDEYPLEAAAALREAAPETEISIMALTMGPASSAAALKKALQISADSAFHLSDDALAGSDAVASSAALAAAIEHIGAEHGGIDLILTGMASTDGETSLVPAMLAERLDFSLVTNADSLEWAEAGSSLAATRSTGSATQSVQTGLPAVVSVTDQANTPRYPNFKAIMAAKKKPVANLSLSDLEISADAVGQAGSAVTVLAAAQRPEREQGTIIRDEGDAGVKLVEFLAAERLI